MMQNAYFTLKTLFVVKIFKFLGHVETRLDWNDQVNFKHEMTTWETNNCNTHIAKYLKK